ncbi:lipopolysaccharide kinase InaA family protein [Pseudazoarcus pumilus]|uniref:Protein kinase domain-containing protein n=1 Tax=Pseudazoarcus pumilus TaxID=2067960 RepID=A0A2I6S8V8_9RHOO|nr:lipopolysaccharide kinase InaA family protein [Pseudazoarcus pumilus]AUN95693.1 hypothetical protein C0099_12590 [Pseudazoarcus pumilus]
MPSRAHYEFLKANLAALLRGRLRLREGHRPVSGHAVPADFVGVGVATSADAATDAAVLDAVSALGVRRVRLDFTQDDANGPVARLLDALIEAGHDVWLHLVQPAEAARRMPGEAAGQEWREFVDSVLARWGARVGAVEIGSTVNRQRWAGYTLEGFLSAWDIAWHTARRHDVTIAGPNVTDFEPPWTVGLLDLLRRRGQLPDIHSDNLFAERATEPERWDHKILGRRLAPLLRVNLMRKARLLQRLGADAGVARMVSPAAFWTLPRIERRLPDSEQKQADYLARYLILCAASGALEAAFWGPLACHREGLIDDGAAPYPRLERITHYAGIEGDPAQWRRRPAFDALAAFNRLIPGSLYAGRLNRGDGLEMHAFERGDARVHALWTTDGRAAALIDLYPPEALAAAEWLDRDGRSLDEAPTLVTESPLYARWPASADVRTKPDAAPLADVVIHRHCAQRHYYVRDAEWHGIVRARDRAEADRLIAGLHPRAIGAAPDKAGSMRLARNAIWAIPDPRDESRRLVAKQPVRHHLHKRLLDRFKPSKARRSWNGACELQRRGLGTAAPVAWFEQRSGRTLTRNWYVCEFVAGGLSVGNLFATWARGETHASGIERDTLFHALADFLVRMHNRGIHFRDLSGGNILVRQDDGLAFSLIDTGRIHVYPAGVPLRARLGDLARATNKLPRSARERMLRLYLAGIGRKLRPWHVWPLAIYDFKVRLKRRIGRKAWKRWFARLRPRKG